MHILEMDVPTHLTLENADYSKAIAYVNGEVGPYTDAKISIRDLGFTRADVVYDLLHVWKGGFFRLDDHLDRFQQSLEIMRLDARKSRTEIRDLITDLVAQSELRDAAVYFGCTRGLPPLGSDDISKCVSTFIAYVRPLVLRGQPEEMRRGMSLAISQTTRRIPSFSVDVRAKNVHRGDFTRALLEAREAGFDNTLLLTHDGYVAEGPTFNVLAFVDGELVAPDENVLQGVSARTMLELAPELGIPSRYGKLTPDDIYRADEVFMTSTSCGLYPVSRIDNKIYCNGVAGPAATKLLNLYYRKKNAGWHITPIEYNRPKSIA